MHDDALSARRRLAEELAFWMSAGYWAFPLAAGWHRRARRLARACGIPLNEILDDLRADAERILQDENA